MKAVYAFTIAIGEDGAPVVSGLVPERIETERAATLLDVRRACQEVLEEIRVNAIAEMVVELNRVRQPSTSDLVSAALKERKSQ